MLPHLRAFGWEPVVLAVEPGAIEGAVIEPLLEKTYPADIEVHRVGALPLKWTRRIGMGTIALRSYLQLRRAGDALMRSQRFDAVFISTAQFMAMALGPRWKRRFGVRYVLDFQDPWRTDHPTESLESSHAPGGSWKYRLSQKQARWCEPHIVREAAGNICVSPEYPRQFARRYPAIPEDRCAVLPFAASETDFAVAKNLPVRFPALAPDRTAETWVYAGIARTDWLSVQAFLAAFADALASGRIDPRTRVLFVGTTYAPGGGPASIKALAESLGIGSQIEEHPARVPFFEALGCLERADAILLFGSNDSSYTASKLFTCALAGKPILAVFHEDSSVPGALRALGVTGLVTFSTKTPVSELASSVSRTWFDPSSARAIPLASELQPHLAPAMTQSFCAALDAWLGLAPAPSGQMNAP